MKFALSRSLWHGRAAGSATQLLDPAGELPRPGVRRRAPRRHDRRPSSGSPRRMRKRVEPARDRAARSGRREARARRAGACSGSRIRSSGGIAPSTKRVTSQPSGSTKSTTSGPTPTAAAARVASSSVRRSIPSSSVFCPATRRTNDAVGTRHLHVVVRDPAAEHLPRRARRRARRARRSRRARAHARTRSPAGSNSGSAATTPATHVSEDLDGHLGVDVVLGREIGVGDRGADGVAEAAARDTPHEPRRRPGRARSRARSPCGSARARQRSRRSGSAGCVERVTADEVPCRASPRSRARPRTACPRARCPRPRRGSPSRGAASRSPCSPPATSPCSRPASQSVVPEPQAELGRAVELPAELADVGDAHGEARDRADRELAGRHVRERLVRRVGRRQRLRGVARLSGPQTPRHAYCDVTSATCTEPSSGAC